MERVGAYLGSLGEGDSLRRRLAEARVLQTWGECVGPQLSARTRPLRLEGGRLTVVAHGSALRQELLFLRKEIVQKINRLAGARLVRELRFLESDAELSTLSAPEEAPRVPRSPQEPAVTTTTEEEVEAPIVPEFDAHAHRERLRAIASGAKSE